jgi:hypothetical protein
MARENKTFQNDPFTEDIKKPLEETQETAVEGAPVAEDESEDILAKYAKKPKRVQSGVYLDADIRLVADKLKKQYGKGIISELINKLLRDEFKKQGLLK